MIRYWDHTEKERAELTEDQIQAMLTVEMMEKGILDPGKSPKIEEPKTVTLPKTTYYKVIFDGYHSFGCVFRTNAEADAFLKLTPLKEDYSYQIGSKFSYAKPSKEGAIQSVELHDHDDVERNASVLKNIKATNDANQKAIEEHTKAIAARDKVTDGVWADWIECKRRGHVMAEIVQTFRNYVKLADGNEVTARKFLAKAYPEPKIVEAFAWCGVADPGEVETKAA